MTDLDQMNDSDGCVLLMTLHCAKGLEFDNVFITGMEEGIFPSGRSLQDEKRLEEERRLCYVGITSTRQRLYLSRARQRMLYNQINHNAPSRFLEEIPARLLRDELAEMKAKAFGADPAPRHEFAERAANARVGALSYGHALNIPGVTKGFAASKAREVVGSAVKNMFQPGDRIVHKKFGEGRVVEITGSGADARIKLEFTSYGVREFALSIAPIVKMDED